MPYFRNAQTVTVDTVLADSEEVDMAGVTGGFIYVPAGSSITTLTFYAAKELGGTYLAAYNTTGAVTLTVAASRSIAIPSDMLGCAAMKMTGNADGTVDVTFQETS